MTLEVRVDRESSIDWFPPGRLRQQYRTTGFWTTQCTQTTGIS